jgi:hypothetical protein
MAESTNEEVLIDWNAGLEKVIKKEGEQAESMFVLHNNASKMSGRNNDFIMIPSIVLQTLTGFLSATGGLINPLILGSVSVFTGILSTLLSYYKFSAKAEGHRVVALLYLKIYKLVEVELALPIEQRMSASKLLEDVRKKIAHIQEIAPEIPDSVIEGYKSKFKNISSAKPLIANGIDEIQIFVGNAKQKGTPATSPVTLNLPSNNIVSE